MIDFAAMSTRRTRHLVLAVLAAALIVSCKAPPMPKVDGGPSPLPEKQPPAQTQQGQAQPAQPGPGGSMTVNIGDVQRGTYASHVFKIKNDLDRVMHVKNVRGS